MQSLEPKEATRRTYQLQSIYFYLTEGCNLRCRHCWIGPAFQHKNVTYPVLDVELFKDIIDQALPLGLKRVKLTGGEPLMHPRIAEILDIIEQKKLKLTVETNAVLCTREIAQRIAKGRSVCVSVSMDGPDAETHEWIRQVPGCFEEAVSGIKHLVAAGLKPQLIMSIVRHNKGRIEDLVKLAGSLGAVSVKFNPVMPIARANNLASQDEIMDVREFIELGRWVEGDLAAKYPALRLLYTYPFAFRPLSHLFSPKGNAGTCAIFNIIGVLASGSYALCGIGHTVPELTFGDAREKKLVEVWNDAPALRKIREELPSGLTGICGMCLMKRFCLGMCIAHSYYKNNNLMAPFWICEEAYAQGLFPESRIDRTLNQR